MSELTVNVPLLRKAVEWAEAEAAKGFALSEWYQPGFVTPPSDATYDDSVIGGRFNGMKAPECGTCYCVAGYVAVEVLHRRLEYVSESYDIAADAMNLSGIQAARLFDGGNTIEDVRRIAESIAGERL